MATTTTMPATPSPCRRDAAPRHHRSRDAFCYPYAIRLAFPLPATLAFRIRMSSTPRTGRPRGVSRTSRDGAFVSQDPQSRDQACDPQSAAASARRQPRARPSRRRQSTPGEAGDDRATAESLRRSQRPLPDATGARNPQSGFRLRMNGRHMQRHGLDRSGSDRRRVRWRLHLRERGIDPHAFAQPARRHRQRTAAPWIIGSPVFRSYPTSCARWRR